MLMEKTDIADYETARKLLLESGSVKRPSIAGKPKKYWAICAFSVIFISDCVLKNSSYES